MHEGKYLTRCVVTDACPGRSVQLLVGAPASADAPPSRPLVRVWLKSGGHLSPCRIGEGSLCRFDSGLSFMFDAYRSESDEPRVKRQVLGGP